jgi:hypothetical protein
MNLCIRLLSTSRGLTPLCLRPGCLINEIISCTSAPRSSTKKIDWLDKRDIQNVPWNTNTCPILSLSQSDSLESNDHTSVIQLHILFWNQCTPLLAAECQTSKSHYIPSLSTRSTRLFKLIDHRFCS